MQSRIRLLRQLCQNRFCQRSTSLFTSIPAPHTKARQRHPTATLPVSRTMSSFTGPSTLTPSPASAASAPGPATTMNVTLSPAELAAWNAILAREAAEKKKPKQKGKPSAAKIEQIRKLKSDRKAFLASLSNEKRDALVPPGQQQADDSAARAAKLDLQRVQQLEALRSFKVPGVDLVDIGANLQERNSRTSITRLLERSAASGTTRIVLTGCSIKSSKTGLATCRWWSAEQRDELVQRVRLYGTVGVHPHEAKSICVSTTTAEGDVDVVSVREDCLQTLKTLAADPFCVSLGECGLDYDRMLSPREMQLAAFEAQVALAASLGKPLFVHLRELDADRGAPIGAYADAAKVLGKYPAIPPDSVCIHCFTGNSADLSQLMERGYMLGVTGFAGMKKRATANGTLAALGATGALPLNRLMIETDAPYMTPDKEWLPKAVGIKGRNEPAALPGVCRAVAAALQQDIEDVARASTSNAVRFFGLDEADERIASLVAAPAVEDKLP